MPFETTLAIVGLILTFVMFVTLTRSRKPLLFQWAASAFLMVVGLLFYRRRGEGLGYFLMFVGMIWMIVQPLTDTIKLMRKIERGETSHTKRVWPRLTRRDQKG